VNIDSRLKRVERDEKPIFTPTPFLEQDKWGGEQRRPPPGNGWRGAGEVAGKNSGKGGTGTTGAHRRRPGAGAGGRPEKGREV
jgi:hypothetical protein